MKTVYIKIAFVLIATAILSSCSTVEFKKTVPKKGKELKTFPRELLGTYIDKQNNDTLIINSSSFKYGTNKSPFKLSGKLTNKATVVKKTADYYILSVKPKNEKHWGVIPFKYDNNKIYIYYLILEEDKDSRAEEKKHKEEKIKRLKTITKLNIIRDSDTKSTSYIINPSDKQFNHLLDGDFFVKILEFDRL